MEEERKETEESNINNVFSEEELERGSNTQKMRVPFSDKLVPCYSHDVIISVGYNYNKYS